MIDFVPKHGSHSAISDYLWCGKAYELKKVRRYPQAPAWWLLGGSAVHTATEWLDRGEWDDTPEMAFHVAFDQEIKEAEAICPDRSTWLSAGYGSRAQGYDHWLRAGPHYVWQWAVRKQDWKWIELDVSATLPNGRKIKAYIDRVDYDPYTGKAEIVDMKTASRRPDSDQQLGIYTALFKHWLNVHPQNLLKPLEVRASHYMFKDDQFYPVDVGNWTLDTVDRLVKDWLNGVKAGAFLPKRGDHCKKCSVAEACYLQSGDTPTTRITDTYNPFYVGDS